MSQYPQQPYPPQGPPMQGPPMGGPPMYAPPPKKKGVILLVLGLLALVVGGILTIIGIGGIAKVGADAQNLAQSTTIFVAPGEKTMALQPGEHFIMSFESMDYQGKTYAPTDTFPATNSVITVKDAAGTELVVENPQAQSNFQGGSNSGEVVRQFNVTTAGNHTVSVTNPDGMEERVIGIFSLEQLMQIIGGAAAGLFGLACGAPLAIIGIILLIVWVIVRK